MVIRALCGAMGICGFDKMRNRSSWTCKGRDHVAIRRVVAASLLHASDSLHDGEVYESHLDTSHVADDLVMIW